MQRHICFSALNLLSNYKKACSPHHICWKIVYFSHFHYISFEFFHFFLPDYNCISLQEAKTTRFCTTQGESKKIIKLEKFLRVLHNSITMRPRKTHTQAHTHCKKRIDWSRLTPPRLRLIRKSIGNWDCFILVLSFDNWKVFFFG